MLTIKRVSSATVRSSADAAMFSNPCWQTKNLGICWLVKDPPVGSFVAMEKRTHFLALYEGAFKLGQPSRAAVMQ